MYIQEIVNLVFPLFPDCYIICTTIQYIIQYNTYKTIQCNLVSLYTFLVNNQIQSCFNVHNGCMCFCFVYVAESKVSLALMRRVCNMYCECVWVCVCVCVWVGGWVCVLKEGFNQFLMRLHLQYMYVWCCKQWKLYHFHYNDNQMYFPVWCFTFVSFHETLGLPYTV